MSEGRGIELTRRKFALGLAFASAAGVAAARQPRDNRDFLGKNKLEDVIPKRIGSWDFAANSGLIIPPEDQLTRATYSQLLTRLYTADNQPPIMLLVAHSGSQTGILQIHRPEFCYSAGGFELSPTVAHPVALAGGTLPALTLEAKADNRVEQIVFWTRIGEHVPSSWSAQKVAVAVDNINGIVPDAVLARVSAFGTDRKAALAAIDRFIPAMVDAIDPSMRKVLVA